MSNIGRFWVFLRCSADGYTDRGMDFHDVQQAARYAARMLSRRGDVLTRPDTAFILDRDAGRLLFGRGQVCDPADVFDLSRVDASRLQWLPLPVA